MDVEGPRVHNLDAQRTLLSLSPFQFVSNYEFGLSLVNKNAV